MIELRKSLITAEDLSIGVGIDTQNRNGSELQLNKINASTILGVLVVASKSTLESLNVNHLVTKVALTQDTSDIYVYNVESMKWEVKTKNVYVIDTYSNIDKVPDGQDIVYSKIDNTIYYRGEDGWSANGTNLYVVNTKAELTSVPKGVNMCITKDEGTLWAYSDNGWKQVTMRLTEELVLYVEELEDLPEDSLIEVAVVKNPKTGGVFVFDKYSTEKSDGAIIVGKWKRQRTGSGVSVLWFGAAGDGITDDTNAFINAFKHGHVVIPEKTYKITSQVICNNDIIIDGNNATIKFENDGCFKFNGKIGNPIDISADFNGGTNEVNVFSGTFEKDTIVRLKSNTANSFSNYGISYSQLNRVVKQDGLTVTLYHPAFATYKQNSQITKLQPTIITINKLKLTGKSSFTFLQFEYCVDSVVNNIVIDTDGSSALKLKESFNIVIENCVIHSVGDGVINAIEIDSSDNIILQNNSIFANTTGIIFSGDNQSNIVVVENTMISANTDAINTEGKVFSLNVQNCIISALNLKVGGQYIRFNTCSISLKGFLYQQKHIGGDFSFDKCSFTGLSSVIDAPFIRIDTPSHLTLKMNSPYNYIFNDCKFTLSNSYSAVAEFYAYFRYTANSKAQSPIKSTIKVTNTFVTSLNAMALGMFRLYGHFYSCNIESVQHNNNAIPLNMSTLKTQVPSVNFNFTDLATKIQELTIDNAIFTTTNTIDKLIYDEKLDKKYFTATTGVEYWNNANETMLSNQTKYVLTPKTFVKSTK